MNPRSLLTALSFLLLPFLSMLSAAVPGNWAAGDYAAGDLVIYDITTYIASQTVSANVGNPTTATAYWSSLDAQAGEKDPPTGQPTSTPDTSTLSGLEIPSDTDSTSDINASGLPNATGEQFVRQQYYDFLGREPDAGGLAYWAGLLDAGTVTRAQVTAEYVFSDEYQNNVGSVARLYYAYLGRLPDAGGFEFWVGQRLAGASLNDISAAFATSTEFISTYGDLDNAAFIDLIYTNVLGRTAEQLAEDAEGRVFWTNQLAASTRGSIMVSFSESAEYTSKMDSEVQIIGFYYGMLRRFPEQEGFDYWVSVLDTGIKPYDLIDTFLDSSEYQARFPALN